jgi:hypothetical protein
MARVLRPLPRTIPHVREEPQHIRPCAKVEASILPHDDPVGQGKGHRSSGDCHLVRVVHEDDLEAGIDQHPHVVSDMRFRAAVEGMRHEQADVLRDVHLMLEDDNRPGLWGANLTRSHVELRRRSDGSMLRWEPEPVARKEHRPRLVLLQVDEQWHNHRVVFVNRGLPSRQAGST